MALQGVRELHRLSPPIYQTAIQAAVDLWAQRPVAPHFQNVETQQEELLRWTVGEWGTFWVSHLHPQHGAAAASALRTIAIDVESEPETLTTAMRQARPALAQAHKAAYDEVADIYGRIGPVASLVLIGRVVNRVTRALDLMARLPFDRHSVELLKSQLSMADHDLDWGATLSGGARGLADTTEVELAAGRTYAYAALALTAARAAEAYANGLGAPAPFVREYTDQMLASITQNPTEVFAVERCAVVERLAEAEATAPLSLGLVRVAGFENVRAFRAAVIDYGHRALSSTYYKQYIKNGRALSWQDPSDFHRRYGTFSRFGCRCSNALINP